MRKIIKKSYISMLYTVGKKNIKKFEIIKEHRHLRNAQIDKLYWTLQRGEHFESQIVVNEVGNKLRIIDGGHRVTAMSRYFDKYPDNKVEINMAIYKDLTLDEEKEVYNTWNRGIRQSPEDYLHLRRGELPVWKMIVVDFPCKVSIYYNKDTLRFVSLLRAYMGAKLYKEATCYSGGPEATFKSALRLDKSDYKIMKNFMKGFVDVFGIPSKENIFSKSTGLTSLMRIYYDNMYEHNDFWDRVRKYIMPSSIIRQYSIIPGRAAISPCHREMLSAINRGRRTNMYIFRGNR